MNPSKEAFENVRQQRLAYIEQQIADTIISISIYEKLQASNFALKDDELNLQQEKFKLSRFKIAHQIASEVK